MSSPRRLRRLIADVRPSSSKPPASAQAISGLERIDLLLQQRAYLAQLVDRYDQRGNSLVALNAVVWAAAFALGFANGKETLSFSAKSVIFAVPVVFPIVSLFCCLWMLHIGERRESSDIESHAQVLRAGATRAVVHALASEQSTAMKVLQQKRSWSRASALLLGIALIGLAIFVLALHSPFFDRHLEAAFNDLVQFVVQREVAHPTFTPHSPGG